MATVSPDGARFSPWLPFPLEGVVVFLVAGSHLVATAVISYRLGLAGFDTAVLSVPPLGMLVFVTVLLSGPSQEETLRQILYWTLGGVGVLGFFITGALLVQGQLSLASAPLLVFITGIGGVGGVLIGYSRGNSIAAERRASELETQQERLLFLNQLLRHNVLNNIAIIKGQASLIAEDHDLADARFETIDERSQAVSGLIEDVRLLVGLFQRQPPVRPMELSEPLREEIEGLRQTYSDVQLETTVPPELTVVADPLLRYVFENVLHNAVEHNDAETPTVEIDARRVEDGVVVSISDNGPGIPASVLEEVETESYELHHGVGLYLVAVLMERYGGDLDISTRNPRGTRVALTFQSPDESIP